MILDKGEGMKVWDLEGKMYYDFIGGIAVNSLGYCHPKIVEAIHKQSEKLIHCSNLFYSSPQILLAKELVRISCGDKVFFGNSGAEANEAAIKLVVKYFKEQDKEKSKIIYMKNSFHGRTIGTLAATGKYKYQKDYLPLLPSFKQAVFNDIDSVKDAYDEKVAAIIVEPIQGEGGINIATAEFIRGLREFCDSKDILLIFDEVQCGLGRSGKMFAYQNYDVEPDILTLAKPLGGGLPLGALIAKEKVASAYKPGDHGTTFGGNPVACSAALAFLKVLQEDGLLEECQNKDKYFREKLETLKLKYDREKYIRETSAEKAKAYTTLNNEKVKSLEETKIANFLFMHCINYEYEKIYPFESTGQVRKSYHPDFYLTDYNIYLEHFGISKDFTVPWLSPIEEKKYLEGIQWKREFHQENETKLIETYSYYSSEGILLKKLEETLLANGVEIKSRDFTDIFNTVYASKSNKYLSEFIKLCCTFITLFKSNNYK